MEKQSRGQLYSSWFRCSSFCSIASASRSVGSGSRWLIWQANNFQIYGLTEVIGGSLKLLGAVIIIICMIAINVKGL